MQNISASDVPVIDIQTVWQYFVGINPGYKKINLQRDAPCIRTPFPEMVIQWTPPGWPHPMQCRVSGDEKVTVVETEIMVPSKGRPTTTVEMYALLGEDGSPSTPFNKTSRTPKRREAPDHDWSGWNFAASNAALCAIGISFMHVKGAVIEDVVTPSPSPLLTRRQKYTAKQQIKVLRIEPLERYLRECNARRKSVAQKRLHIVRGHFKDFSRGPGVGGNPLARGLYWTPPHVRGSAARGIVAKQYEIGEVE